MTRVAAWWIPGIALIIIGAFLPRDWYDSLPRTAGMPLPPIRGVTLLQLSLLVEGVVLLVLGLKRWSFARLGETERVTSPADSARPKSTRGALAALAAITLLGLSLRLFRLGSDLWLDEIAPILEYGPLSPLQVIGSYVGTNNHLLNTLLGKLAVGTFGETEWAIRLPAALLGTATIPAIYWVARLGLSTEVSLGASLLLAVSYHHVFFSQNARGYSAYLFFAILSAGLLVKGLQEDRARTWALYVAAMVLGFASLLNTVFVYAAHVLVGGVVLILLRRRGAPVGPLLNRLAVVFGVTAFLVFQLYATIIPEAYVVIRTLYRTEASGYRGASGEFLQELIRGLSAGFGSGLLLGVLPFLVVAAVGFVSLLRRQWALAAALALPVVLTALVLTVNRLSFSPRFFLLALPLAILAAVQGLWGGATAGLRILPRRSDGAARGLAWALVLLVAVVSLAALRHYYVVPKQAYRASIEYVERQREPGDVVMVVYLAEKGYRYYGKRFGLREGQDYFFVRTPEAFDAIRASHGAERILLVTTFPRALRLSLPTIYERMTKEWRPVRIFPATIGDGEISVWRSRTS